MNTDENKTKIQVNVAKVKHYIARSRIYLVVWMDESNCNLFTSRSQAWSKVGTRANVKHAASKGSNIHIIAGLCVAQGLFIRKGEEEQTGNQMLSFCCRI